MVAYVYNIVIKKIKFYKIILLRFFKILFKRKKSIEVVYINYSDKHLFESSYIVINYYFKNALWYRFGKYTTTDKHIKVLNLRNIKKEFDLVVYGFFRKAVFRLKFQPQNSLNSEQFSTSFYSLSNDLKLKATPSFLLIHIPIQLNEIKLNNTEVICQHKTLSLKTNPYKQTDFI